MRSNPHHASDNPADGRALIAANPWATRVSANDGHLIAALRAAGPHWNPELADEMELELGLRSHGSAGDGVSPA